ncbi:MurR/RpiR family transcriptional regulator [Bacillus velezensis]|uniref:MurR/RpiR family transcriptional regulator n=1 Tax=Bacillus velezensis TaxID=492670 RepID=UPI0018E791EE|nr:MurR/RpiR family transcriptional regulator [Bacillus velezensis]MDL5025228.1 MurR/RpiR family transcriptional regulator [Bacillus velezensis]MEC2147546.1 MurR/RpiR family transcriptional regulator [Bacillus velezensis]MEC3609864.1 MurR/RpiR family transcriptional regulator [Bacillus velezensis]MEC3678264.1 MurR/RpiR family transcriptional regulator [Bacillus velezensis]
MSLEELVNQHYAKLNDNDFYILKYILNHKHTCYHLGINDMAKACNVSRSSILRLAQKLGFSGYSEFRVFLKWEDQPEEGENMTFEKLLDDIEANVKYVKSKDMTEMCRLIDEAKRIFVYGSGTAQRVCARELQRMFVSRRKYLILIQDITEFDIMCDDFKVDDVFIIISLSGETPELIPQVRTLSAKGVPFISITNLKNNVLAQTTPYNLYATSKPVTLSDKTEIVAFAPFFLVGEALFRAYVDYKEIENFDK